MRNFVKIKSLQLTKLLFHLVLKVNHVIVVIVYITNMSFNAKCENKIFAKISEFTVMGQLVEQFRLGIVELQVRASLLGNFVFEQDTLYALSAAKNWFNPGRRVLAGLKNC